MPLIRKSYEDLSGSTDSRLTAFCDAINNHQNTSHTFEHFLRLNRNNNQAFFLSGFCHMFNNPINSILLGSRLLGNYTQEIIDLFDELIDDPALVPVGLQEARLNVLSDMPMVIQGISD